ncbi:MAG: (S)-benzoin forming benzil reductase [Thermotogota bacterium]
MNFFIITGTSKGLGEAIAKKLVSPENQLACISRSKNLDLIDLADHKNCVLDYYEFDLTNTKDIKGLMSEILSKIDINKVTKITLINNAGTVEPIKPMGRSDDSDIQRNITLNLISPSILINNFIKYTKDTPVKKDIFNISSGAATRAVYGWAPYCSSKAGINLLTQTAALELEETEYNVYSFSPGVVDTSMQKRIRSSSEEDFVELNRFIGLKEEGKLLKPSMVAEKIIEILENNQLKNGGIYHMKEFI